MKRLGIIVLVIAGFVGGIAFVYSCGGGGSDVFAGGDADTLSILELVRTRPLPFLLNALLPI